MMEMTPIIRAFPSFTADSFLHSPYWAVLTMTQTCDWSRDQSEDDQTREEGRHGDSDGDDEGVSLVSGVGGGTCSRQLIVCHRARMTAARRHWSRPLLVAVTRHR